MPALASSISPASDDFRANAAAMRALVEDIRAMVEAV
jgi:3-methylcrotonyl-CoA carboxylase beta subunit